MIISCYHVLKQIEARPAMWTGEENLQSIQIYLSGYYHALQDTNLVPDSRTDVSFAAWVAQKLGYEASTAGWVNLIIAHCLGLETKSIHWEQLISLHLTREQHAASIRKFYELVEEYMTESRKNNPGLL